jgi:DHA1 family multidrug resistance protein-like MFS transporter
VPKATVGKVGEHTSWRQIIVISAAGFVVWTGFGAILPYLPVFLQEEAHTSLGMIGVIATMYFVGTFLFSFPMGWLSDRIGRKPVLVSGIAVFAVSTFLFTRTADPTWFVLFRLLEGLGTAAVMPAGQAFIADTTSERNRSKAFGALTTAQFGGLVAGPALAAPLYHMGGGGRAGFYTIFYFGAILAAVAAVAALALLKEPPRHVAHIADSVREGGRVLPPLKVVFAPAVAAFLVVAFASHIAMGGWEVIWSIYLRGLGASMEYVSWTWIAFSVPMLLSFFGGVLADRYNRFALMFTGYAISAVAWILYGVTTNLTLFLAVNVIEGFAIAFSWPAKQAFFVQVVPRRWLGSLLGVENSVMQLAGGLGTVSAPLVYGWIGGHVLAVGGVFNLLGLIVAAPVLLRAYRRVRATAAESVAGDEVASTPEGSPLLRPDVPEA